MPVQTAQVEARGDRPARLTWQGRTYLVEAVLDEWRYGGRWWLGERPRDCFLVQAGALTAELHHEDGPEGRWWLARLVD
ncbi:hypothetical protein EXW95_01095 [Deinococcus sp. JMULE3]|nr:hypothetical protein [Deinococcus sp. JMULE3]